MSTAVLSHPDCLDHITPQGHPERVARLEAIYQELEEARFAGLLRIDAPLAIEEQILRVHPAGHIAAIRAAIPTSGSAPLDADTHVSPGSLNAALRAAGACVAAVDLVMEGKVSTAFCAVRPPGHHAESDRPMGFCLFGNVVIGALHALEHHGLARVAIVDFDVHHGNGTQALVWDDARILFASTHQMPLYPGSGAAPEVGAHGQIVNVPLAPHSSGADFRRAMEAHVFPAVDAHAPEMIFVSAGFDAHADDPLANLNLREADYAWVTERLCDLADKHCEGRVVSTLEGGYDLQSLAASVAAHLTVLMERGK